jgi:hypothetical protein
MISVAITNFNRSDMVIESFINIINNIFIDEIVIVDDCSDIDIYNKLVTLITALNNDKVKLYRNEKNLKLFKNKYESVRRCTNEWVVVFDSDNILNNDYINIIEKIDKKEEIMYSPETLDSTSLNYKEFVNHIIDRHNIKNYIDNSNFQILLNTGNHCINRKKYMEACGCADDNLSLADSIYISYLWLSCDNKIEVIKGLHYYHRVHNGSWYINNTKNYINSIPEIIKKIKEL